MRDIIWTIIVVWLVWRLIDAFKGFSQRTSNVNTNNNNNRHYDRSTQEQQNHTAAASKKGHLKPDAGEYVDYEETK